MGKRKFLADIWNGFSSQFELAVPKSTTTLQMGTIKVDPDSMAERVLISVETDVPVILVTSNELDSIMNHEEGR